MKKVILLIIFTLVHFNIFADQLIKKGDYFVLKNSGKRFTGKASTQYKNGNIKSRIQYKNGKRKGLSTTWYIDGTKETEGYFKDGNKNGIYQVWHKNGLIKSKVSYQAGLIQGFYEEWSSDGPKILREYYVDNVKSGVSERYYSTPTKVLKEKCNYKNGKVKGPLKKWSIYGKLIYDEFYLDGKQHGPKTVWYLNGKKKSEDTFQKGKRNGLSTRWYRNGKKMSESTYVFGLEHGKYKKWTPAGLLDYQVDKQYSKFHGKYQMMRPHDQTKLILEIEFSKGKKIGLYKSWYDTPSNRLKKECLYQNDVIHGAYKMWHDNSQHQLKMECLYKNGKLDGRYKAWSGRGQLIADEGYQDGQFHGSMKRWHSNGKIHYNTNYINGKIHGAHVVKDKEGYTIANDTYNNGIKKIVIKVDKKEVARVKRQKQEKVNTAERIKNKLADDKYKIKNGIITVKGFYIGMNIEDALKLVNGKHTKVFHQSFSIKEGDSFKIKKSHTGQYYVGYEVTTIDGVTDYSTGIISDKESKITEIAFSTDTATALFNTKDLTLVKFTEAFIAGYKTPDFIPYTEKNLDIFDPNKFTSGYRCTSENGWQVTITEKKAIVIKKIVSKKDQKFD